MIQVNIGRGKKYHFAFLQFSHAGQRMNILRLAVPFVGMLATSSAVAQSSLPQCPVLSVAKVPWTDCQGSITFSDGSKYVGAFTDGKMSGHGTMFNADGTKSVGEFRDGKMNGQGSLTWANGTKYVGEFRDSKMNGQGTLTWADGRKYVGEFSDGTMIGQGTMYTADGRKNSGIWENGKFIETGRDALAPK